MEIAPQITALFGEIFIDSKLDQFYLITELKEKITLDCEKMKEQLKQFEGLPLILCGQIHESLELNQKVKTMRVDHFEPVQLQKFIA